MKLSNKLIFLFCLVFFTVFTLNFIPWHHNYVRQHDEFDGNFSSRHLLVRSGKFFAINPTETVYGSMNGIPRACYMRFTEPVALFMYLFGSLKGYALSFLFVRIIAFLGLFLFGRDYIIKEKADKGLLILMSTLYASLPYNTSYCLSISGIPLFMWAAINLMNLKRIKSSYFVLVFLALSSNFILSGFHMAIMMFVLFLFNLFQNKTINKQLIVGLVIFSITYILSEYMLFYNYFSNPSYQSSRSGFVKELSLNLKGVIGITVQNFFSGEYNAANYFGYLFFPFLLFAMYKFIFIKEERNNLFIICLVFLIVCSFFAAFFDWEKLKILYEKLTILNVFNMKRFISLVPGLFFIVISWAIYCCIQKGNRIFIAGCYTAVIFSFVLVWRGNMARVRSSFDCKGIELKGDTPYTFDSFFDVTAFKDIKNHMGSDTLNNTISFGIYPSLSKYANLNVLDDYQGDYPLAYKMEFRKIIEKEIEKSEALRDVFDKWGSKCYLYSKNSFENTLSKVGNFSCENNLEINTEQLKKMNCKYIISSIIIGNQKQLNLYLSKIIVSKETMRTYLLYKIS